MKKNLALIGMSGTLKSTVGRRLAKKLQLLFIDTDDMIEFETGRSIPEIFELAGEDYFRSLERKLVASLSDYDGAVISTGGGVGADDENMRALSEHCTVVWLDATPRTIFYRLKNTKRTRPKLEPFSLKKVEELCLLRKADYARHADVKIDTDFCNASRVAQKITDFLDCGVKLQNKLQQTRLAKQIARRVCYSFFLFFVFPSLLLILFRRYTASTIIPVTKKIPTIPIPIIERDLSILSVLTLRKKFKIA